MILNKYITLSIVIINILIIFKFIYDYLKKAKNNSLNNNDQFLNKTLLSANSQIKHDQLFNILNSMSVPIWERNSELKIIYFNKYYGSLIAIDHDLQLDMVNLEINNQIKKLAENAISTGLNQSENLHVIIEGKRYLYNIVEVATNTGTIGYAIDITEEEKTKQELDRHISSQSDLMESSASGIAIFGANTRVEFFNQTFIKLWGLNEIWMATKPTLGEIIEDLRERRMLPEHPDFQAYKKNRVKLFTDLTGTHNEFIYLPNGKALRVLIIPHAFGGLLFSYDDMTNYITLESSYNTLIAVQKTTLDNLQEAVAVFGSDGRLRLSNPMYAKMWGLSEELLSKNPHINEIIDAIEYCFDQEKNWLDFKNSLLSTILTRKKIKKQIIERLDGSVLTRMSVQLPDGGTLINYIDITDSTLVEHSLREKNKALSEVDKMKTEFLANVSYELRSPLTSIVGLSEALDREYFGELNEKQKEYIKGISSSSNYLMILINDILDLASIEAGYLKLNISEFNLHNSINSIFPLIKERIKELNLQFSFESKNESLMMIGDELRIKQLVFKLLSNAIKFSKDGGFVKLSILEEVDHIILRIEDDGIGIDQDKQAQVFDKFYKHDIYNRRNKPGAGLGLSVVKNLVELHSGEIILESKYNVGTIVTCKFNKS